MRLCGVAFVLRDPAMRSACSRTGRLARLAWLTAVGAGFVIRECGEPFFEVLSQHDGAPAALYGAQAALVDLLIKKASAAVAFLHKLCQLEGSFACFLE